MSSASEIIVFDSKNKSSAVARDTRPAVPTQVVDQNSQHPEDHAFLSLHYCSCRRKTSLCSIRI